MTEINSKIETLYSSQIYFCCPKPKLHQVWSIFSISIGLAMGINAGYLYLEVSKSFTDIKFLSYFLASGYFISFVALTVLSFRDISTNIKRDLIFSKIFRSKNRIKTLIINISNKLIWFTAFILGLLSILATSYVGYKYNGESAYGAVGIGATVFIINTNSFGILITNLFNYFLLMNNSEKHHETISRAKSNFKALSQLELIELANEAINMKLEISRPDDYFNLINFIKSNEALIEKRQRSGVRHWINNLAATFSSLLLSICWAYIAFRLSNEGLQKIIDSEILTTIIALFSIFPGTFLEMTFTRRVYYKIFDLVMTCISKDRQELPLAGRMSTVMFTLSLLATVPFAFISFSARGTLLGDYVTGLNYWLLFAPIYISTTAYKLYSIPVLANECANTAKYIVAKPEVKNVYRLFNMIDDAEYIAYQIAPICEDDSNENLEESSQATQEVHAC